MKRMSRFIAFFLVLFNFASFALPAENIRITIVLINEVTGEPISNNFDIKVSSHPDGKLILVQTAKKRSFYEIKAGTIIRVKATANGFYSEEKGFDTKEMSDGDIIELRMNPKPSGNLRILTIDSETKDPVAGVVEIDFHNQKTKEIIDEDHPQGSFVYEQQGVYKLLTIADGYLNDTRELNLNISPEQTQSEVVIELVKNRMKQEIGLYDKSNNGKILSGKVKITHKETGQVVYHGNVVNSSIKFDANRDDKYFLNIISDGYIEFNQPFQLSGKMLRFGLSPNAAFLIDVYDEESGKRLSTNIDLISPSGKRSSIKSSDSQSIGFNPTEIGTYQLISKADGYINKSGRLIVKSMNAGSTFFTLRLKKGSNEYTLSVVDSQDKTPVNTAQVRVYNEKSVEIQGTTIKNIKKVNLEEDKKHFYEVSATGYYDNTGNIKIGEKTVEILLKKKIDTLSSISIVVLDFQTALPVVDPRIKIIDENKNPVATTYDGTKGEFFCDKLNSKNTYTFELNAKGYKSVMGEISKGEKTKSINLVSTESNDFVIKFSDEFTKEPIFPEVTIFANKKEIFREKIKESAKVQMSNTNSYLVESNLDGYKKFSKSVDKREASGNEFNYKILKELYGIDFKFDEDITIDQAKLSQIKLINKQTERDEKLILGPKNSGFSAKISPDITYIIKVSLPGFQDYSNVFTLKMANASDLSYIIKLISKEKPVKEVKPEEKPIVVAEAVLDVANIQKGVKYPLPGVNFEKSKTILVPGAETKLEGLLKYLKENPNVKVEIAGHTDNEGNDQRLNQRLSEFRAKVVANYFFNKGIKSERLKTIGKGSSEPLVPNDTEENKAKNRRIEIMIFDN